MIDCFETSRCMINGYQDILTPCETNFQIAKVGVWWSYVVLPRPSTARVKPRRSTMRAKTRMASKRSIVRSIE